MAIQWKATSGMLALAGAAFACAPALAQTPGPDAISRVPLQFEASGSAAFTARGSGYAVRVGRDFSAVRLQSRSGGCVVRERLVGANGRAIIGPASAIVGRINRLIGRDRSAWRTGIPAYGRVQVRQAYPGIDVVYYGNQRRLEADYRVAPGADPGRIALAFDGATSGRLEANGDLVLSTAAGPLRKTRPVAYQTINGRRVPVSAAFRLADGGLSARFVVGAYDRTRLLVIDPVIEYGTFIGGTGEDWTQGITIGPDGSLFAVGATASGDFPTTPGAFDTVANGGFYDVTVTKINPRGDLGYSTFLGGSGTDQPSAIRLYGGLAYICGDTDSLNFPMAPGGYESVYGGGSADAFIAVLSADGSALVYTTLLGGANYDTLRGMVVNATGVYVTGWTQSPDYPVASAFQGTIANAGQAALASKLDLTLSTLTYSTFLRGTDLSVNEYQRWSMGQGIAVDAAGQAVVVGSSNSTTYPTTAGAYQTTAKGGYDAFVTKLTADGTGAVFSTLLGKVWHEGANAVALAANGDVLLGGYTESSTFPATVGAAQTAYAGSGDGFVARLNPTGSALKWCTFLGGSGEDAVEAISTDNGGSVYVCGQTYSTNFPVTANAPTPAAQGASDGFLTKVGSTGSAFLFSTYCGGVGDDSTLAMANLNSGSAYVAGWTTSTTLPLPAGGFQPTYGGGFSDGFVLRLTPPNVGTVVGAVNRSGAVGDNISLTGYLWRSSVGVPGKTLKFWMSGAVIGTAVTNAAGRADLPYTIPVGFPASRDYTVEFVGDLDYLADAATATVTRIEKIATSLFTINRTVPAASSTYLRGYLYRTGVGTWVAGKTVAFKVNGTSVGSAVTDSNGRASLLYPVPYGHASPVAILATFTGDGTYLGSSGSATLTVTAPLTSMFVQPRSVTTGANTYLRAYLRNYLGAWLPGKSVSMKVNGTPVGSDTTDANGRASILYSVALGAGSYPIVAEYTGDGSDGPSSGTGTLTVTP